MDAKKRFDKLFAYLKKWCVNPSMDLRANWERELTKASRQLNRKSLAVASLQLWFWATWHAQHGLLAVLNGEVTGWQQLELSFRYRWWKLRIDSVLVQISDAALLLAHALGSADRERGIWLRKYLLDSMAGDQAGLWKFSHFGFFTLHLAQKDSLDSATAELDKLPNAPTLGVYAAVIDAWSHVEGMEPSLLAMLDYHLQQALTEQGYPEFGVSPYNLLPIDYLAVRSVRARHGLPTPVPNHPLLRAELLDPPSTWNEPLLEPDPAVAKLVSAAQSAGLWPV